LADENNSGAQNDLRGKYPGKSCRDHGVFLSEWKKWTEFDLDFSGMLVEAPEIIKDWKVVHYD